ncbi:MAG: hypothetical protein JXN59_11310 [Anaerolineae bacterium]|nr:hypothetical protein [Anaerolineae bacterium]
MDVCVAWPLGIGLFGAVFYYGAILLGIYKDSLMALFRRYGEEPPVNALARFLLALGLLLLVLVPLMGGGMTGTVLTTAAFLCLAASFAATRISLLRDTLPRWYYSLLQVTNRQERRAIAYAWMRLPLRTRLRLNGDNYAFHIFVDEIRLTVVYGARDPDDPWGMWQ